jgi:hypothetical protein
MGLYLMIMSKSLNKISKKTQWTLAMDAVMVARYPNVKAAVVAEQLGISLSSVYNRASTLGLEKSESFKSSLESCRLRQEQTEAQKANRFKTGHLPFNKGIKGINYQGMQATQFSKGNKPANYKPVGTIRFIRDKTDGYFEIKMADGTRQWKLLHRVIWERLNGAIPTNHIVIFLDGNSKNLNIKNMALMTKAQNMKRNTVHNYPPEIVHLVQLKAALNRQINKRTQL